jgi:hypothetical protein
MGYGAGGPESATQAQPSPTARAETPANPWSERAVPEPSELLPDVEAEVTDLAVPHDVVLALEPLLAARP